MTLHYETRVHVYEFLLAWSFFYCTNDVGIILEEIKTPYAFKFVHVWFTQLYE